MCNGHTTGVELVHTFRGTWHTCWMKVTHIVLWNQRSMWVKLTHGVRHVQPTHVSCVKDTGEERQRSLSTSRDGRRSSNKRFDHSTLRRGCCRCHGCDVFSGRSGIVLTRHLGLLDLNVLIVVPSYHWLWPDYALSFRVDHMVHYHWHWNASHKLLFSADRTIR